jgi:hypothetical protein
LLAANCAEFAFIVVYSASEDGPFAAQPMWLRAGGRLHAQQLEV